jgi:CRISPR-associated endoribonuclease Cas6
MLAGFRIPLQVNERWVILPAAHGRAVRALLYRWIAKSRSELAARFHHASGSPPKPFACSLLLGAPLPHRGGLLLTRGDTYWLEVNALSEDAAEALRQGLPAPGEPLRLARTELVVAGPVVTEEASYCQLLAERPLSRWWFHFLSPVVIEPEGMDGPLLLPMPRYLFSNLVQKWNAFAPQEEKGLPRFPIAETLARIESMVGVAEVASLSTTGLWGPAGGLWGFVGKVQFEAHDAPREDLIGLGALVRLAKWAGIGGRTLEGAGRTEVLVEEK